MRHFPVTKNDFSSNSVAHEILSLSGMLDVDGYRQRQHLPPDIDPVAHYLDYGWKEGIEPCDDFQGSFLYPYYTASGLNDAPVITWLNLLSHAGRRPPRAQEEALLRAEQIRNSPFFDATYYAKRLPSDIDPAIHYVVAGELLGYKPSDSFDPDFYMDLYDDIGSNGLSPLQHYITYGQHEGRRTRSAADRLVFPQIEADGRPAIVVVLHEASRTGAPLLGWAVAQGLREKYNIISLLMRGGSLEAHFGEISKVIIGPLVWEEWSEIELTRIAQRISDLYRPLYVIANSIETRLAVPAFAKFGIPSVALVHEFASYTRPIEKMRDVFDWASHIIFPANVVQRASFANFPSLAYRRGVHVLAQGPVPLPSNLSTDHSISEKSKSQLALEKSIYEAKSRGEFLVVGLGTIQLRKGVDLFIAAAAAVKLLMPELPVRFLFVGEGYNPRDDWSYSVYLAEQIIQSNLQDYLEILEPVANLEPIYESMDLFFMSSRLDPQPNVGIDAVTRGIPTVCFAGACGTAEILAKDPVTDLLVVPHLNAHLAGEAIIKVAKDPSLLKTVRERTKEVGSISYNMRTYIDRIDDWGVEASRALRTGRIDSSFVHSPIDPELALPPGINMPGVFGLERCVEHQWAVVGLSPDQVSNPYFRRPYPGFHPQAYAQAYFDDCVVEGHNPFAHWLRSGKPLGPWSRKVFSPQASASFSHGSLRVLLHGHFFYTDSAPDLLRRLSINKAVCDLILTTDTDDKAQRLLRLTSSYPGHVEVRVMPNSGRDIGPLITGLREELSSSTYDLIGHVHGKHSAGIDTAMGRVWRDFIWDNLIGGGAPMLDLAITAFGENLDLGLLIPEDPHLVGWDSNRSIAKELADKMHISEPLPDFFDFPLGTMFWARPEALKPLMALGLSWEDYPSEPLPDDGTLLHAIERLIPFSVRKSGFEIGGLRMPGSTW